MAYMNTAVTRGAGEFAVTATGMAAEVGRISGMLQAHRAARTPLTRQLDRLSKQLLLVASVALIASMAANLSRGYTFGTVFNAAVAFAIAAVPVRLPTVVTTILAWGTQSLTRAGVIMRRLRSAETLGSVSVIDTDTCQWDRVLSAAAGHRRICRPGHHKSPGRRATSNFHPVSITAARQFHPPRR